MITDRLGLYIHVPFCASRCYYCDFCSQATRDVDKMRAYTKALCSEIVDFSKKQVDKRVVDTLYLGGGTPILLPEQCIEQILNCITSCFELDSDAEITIEANPKTADCKKLCHLFSLGINRLSVGMQSANDGELKLLGRAHSFEDTRHFFADARRAGFENISLDLMYGIPGQSLESFGASIDEAILLAPEHISSYCLKIEEGTSFYRRRDSLSLPDDDTVSDMYELLCDRLEGHGYNKYEISNFSLTGRESRHNLKYWEYNDYIGFGPGAHSFFEGERIAILPDIDRYIAGEIDKEVQSISADEAENEYVMLSMRLSRGVSAEEFEARFCKSFYSVFGKALEKFSPEFVTLDSDGCRFTQKGMYVSNYILSEVLNF